MRVSKLVKQGRPEKQYFALKCLVTAALATYRLGPQVGAGAEADADAGALLAPPNDGNSSLLAVLGAAAA